jgi:hypothetical protein
VSVAAQLSEAVHPSIWRGLVVSFPTALAKKLRAWRRGEEGTDVRPKEILKHLGQVGKHWSHSKFIAERFGTRGVGPRGNTFGVRLRANIPKAGGDSEAGKVFWDEQEFDIPAGTDIEIIGINVYKPGKKSDYPWDWISGVSSGSPKKGDTIRWKA